MATDETKSDQANPDKIETYIRNCMTEGMSNTEIRKISRAVNSTMIDYEVIARIRDEYNRDMGKNSIQNSEYVCRVCTDKKNGFIDMDCNDCPYKHSISTLIELEQIKSEKIEADIDDAFWEAGIKILEDGRR